MALIWTWPCSVCWPLWLLRCGSQNTFWLDSNHNAWSWNPELLLETPLADALFCCPAEIWSVLMCSGALSKVSANKTDGRILYWFGVDGGLITLCNSFVFVPMQLPNLFARRPKMTSPLPVKIDLNEGGMGHAKPSGSSVCHLSYFDIEYWLSFLDRALPLRAGQHK